MDDLCYLCLVFVMLSRLFIAALWSPEGKGMTSWLLFVMFIAICLFLFGILGQVCYMYLIVSIPDPCCLSSFDLILELCWTFPIGETACMHIPHRTLISIKVSSAGPYHFGTTW